MRGFLFLSILSLITVISCNSVLPQPKETTCANLADTIVSDREEWGDSNIIEEIERVRRVQEGADGVDCKGLAYFNNGSVLGIKFSNLNKDYEYELERLATEETECEYVAEEITVGIAEQVDQGISSQIVYKVYTPNLLKQSPQQIVCAAKVAASGIGSSEYLAFRAFLDEDGDSFFEWLFGHEPFSVSPFEDP